ncbi:hypothetical protein E2542_SST10283 [Spatholobus suberectus]|nr:hypothetical protein E2542_SST10283 [Spatholobus suberectus]
MKLTVGSKWLGKNEVKTGPVLSIYYTTDELVMVGPRLPSNNPLTVTTKRQHIDFETEFGVSVVERREEGRHGEANQCRGFRIRGRQKPLDSDFCFSISLLFGYCG